MVLVLVLCMCCGFAVLLVVLLLTQITSRSIDIYFSYFLNVRYRTPRPRLLCQEAFPLLLLLATFCDPAMHVMLPWSCAPSFSYNEQCIFGSEDRWKGMSACFCSVLFPSLKVVVFIASLDRGTVVALTAFGSTPIRCQLLLRACVDQQAGLSLPWRRPHSL